ncbi:MAG: LysR family transcriptional regulator [Parvibaculum sp.]|nr:LysR family transcriptional regulator [Parvibaculum sp.]
MKQIEPGWEHYRTLLAVIREGSLSAAARALGLTQPTIGRHVDAMEESLGLALFTRSQGGLAPTESALALMPHAEAMANAAEALRRTATGEAEEDRGTVRITVSEMIGTEVLPAILTRFREKHPRIAIELMLSNRSEDLLQREADIAVRMVQPTQAALLAKKVGVLNIGLHAHRAYLAAHGTPKTIDDLREHSVIGYDRDPSVRRQLNLGIELTRELFSFRCDSDVAQFAALRAGFGIGMCQYTLAKRYPDLVPLLDGLVKFELGVWIVMHEDHKTSLRMRLMFDHLATELADYVNGK